MKRTVWCYRRLLKLKNEIINEQTVGGLCFCSCVCKLHRPPALIFELSLDEKQNIKLLWPNSLYGNTHLWC